MCGEVWALERGPMEDHDGSSLPGLCDAARGSRSSGRGVYADPAEAVQLEAEHWSSEVGVASEDRRQLLLLEPLCQDLSLSHFIFFACSLFFCPVQQFYSMFTF